MPEPRDSTADVAAPAEGNATTRKEIADELSKALNSFERADYNAFMPDELRELLEARETVKELCLKYRQEQQRRRQRESGD